MFGTSRGGDTDAEFDEPGSFVPAHLPEPGPFLADATVLTGETHAAVHATAHELFEARGVYDITFGYNLAKLNRDRRHEDAGFRYGREDATTLRAEFTPTTAFCPQGDTLAKAAFRAWNGLAERHEYDLVRVRICPTHQSSETVNAALRELEEQFVETGSLSAPDGESTGTAEADESVPSSPL